MTGLVEFGLYLTYILVGVAVLAVIVLPLINAVSNPRSLVISGIGLAALLVVFLIQNTLHLSSTKIAFVHWNLIS